MKRWVYVFRHRTRYVEFGPHEDERAAKTAFQFRYGYWPEAPENQWLWLGGTTPTDAPEGA